MQGREKEITYSVSFLKGRPPLPDNPVFFGLHPNVEIVFGVATVFFGGCFRENPQCNHSNLGLEGLCGFGV